MDIRCWRCNHKLAVNETGVGSVVIKCSNCRATNRVNLDKGLTVAAN
jgi:phage FluMu protein Com